MAAPDAQDLSDDDLRAQITNAFQVAPCQWQIEVVRSLLRLSRRLDTRDLCLISATGSGKTLTFLAPLLFEPHKIMVIISPLNILSDQIAGQLRSQGLPAISLCGDNATKSVFQEIRELKYRVIVTNVEIAKRTKGEFEKLWRDRKWTAHLLCIVWDEAHCISQWADFRAEYKDGGRIRQLIGTHVPFYLTSATLPKAVLADVFQNLNIRASDVDVIHRSNDRPNIHLVVRRMQHGASSYRDLDFVLPAPGCTPPKFVIFFDSIRESVEAIKYLWSRLPESCRDRIKWFNSHMTSQYREDELQRLASGENWGLVCTESFGLGVDKVQDLQLVVQYKAADVSLCALWQRLGRALRNGEGTATAVFIVEPKFFDEEREAKEGRKKKKLEKENKKRKAEESGMGARKSPRLDGDVDLTERSVVIERRRAIYDAPPARPLKKKDRADRDSSTLDPALDDVINAASRGFGCHRLPAQVFFGNDKISGSFLVTPSHAYVLISLRSQLRHRSLAEAVDARVVRPGPLLAVVPYALPRSLSIIFRRRRDNRWTTNRAPALVGRRNMNVTRRTTVFSARFTTGG
ncbi:P-loop containing nucleoside triphosphate hydrolase protein [Schizophyllum commune]